MGILSGFPLICSAYDFVVPARGKELIKTDLSIKCPSGTYGRVAPRSGLAWKNFIDTGAGVIDEVRMCASFSPEVAQEAEGEFPIALHGMHGRETTLEQSST